MANYESKARTNYFKVKHATRFATWAKKVGAELVRDSKDPDLVAMLFDDSGIPDSYHDDKKDDYVEIDFALELSRHLKPDYVAIIQEIGSEGMRYVSGQAVAVNSKGEQVFLQLNDIYEKARRLGRRTTACEY